MITWKKHFKSRNAVFNIPRRNEPVATDTILSDTPAIHDGSTMEQFCVGKDTLVCDAYGIKSQKQFFNKLMTISRQEELWIPSSLMVENMKFQRWLLTFSVACSLNSMNQNLIISIKTKLSNVMGLSKGTGVPAHCWLLCLLYVCSLLNAKPSPALDGITPLQALTGQVPDISHFLHFCFWEPVNIR